MGLNDEIQSEFISHAVDLAKLDAGARKEVLGSLHTLAEDLQKKIQDLGPAPAAPTAKVKRLKEFLSTTNDTIDHAYKNIAETSKDHLVSVGEIANKKSINILNKSIGAPLAKGTLTKEDLVASLGNTMIQGHPAQAWWDKQSQDTINAFTGQMRMGYLQGETVQQMIERIRGKYTGTKSVVMVNGKPKSVNNYAGGVMQVSTKQAEALVRTAVATMANKVHNDTYNANGDIIRARKWVATLDGRTTPVCIARDGGVWDMSGNPTKESKIKIMFPGPPPAHFNCRSILVPITKSWKDIIEEAGGKVPKGMPEPPVGTRASMDGQVPADISYQEWLKTKPEGFQKEVLGDTKWKLWNDGKLNLTQLVDQSGQPYTVKDLKQIYKIEDAHAETEKKLEATHADVANKADSVLSKSVRERVAKMDAQQARDEAITANQKAEEAKAKADQLAAEKQAAADAAQQQLDAAAAKHAAEQAELKAEAEKLSEQAKQEFKKKMEEQKKAAQDKADALAKAKADADAKALAEKQAAEQAAADAADKAANEAYALAKQHEYEVEQAKKAAKAKADALAAKVAKEKAALAAYEAELKKKAEDDAAQQAAIDKMTKAMEQKAAMKKAAEDAAAAIKQQKENDAILLEEQHAAEVAAAEAKIQAAKDLATATAKQAAEDATRAAEKQAKAKAGRVAMKNPELFPADVASLKVVKKLGGSTGAELVEDSHGRRFVRKYGANAEHVQEEYAAEEMYRAAGVPVPASRVYDDGGKPVKLSVFKVGAVGSALKGSDKTKAENQMRAGFAMDALMGNWDAAGTGFDNVLLDSDGVLQRIDVGGSLRFRAQGALKTEDQWNGYPVELWTLRNKKVNPNIESNMERIMGALTHAEVVGQVEAILSKREQILAVTPDGLKDTVSERLNNMEKMAKTSRALLNDKFKDGYTSDMTRHQMGINKVGIGKMLPSQLTQPGGYGDVHLVDEFGVPWDNLRSTGSDSIPAKFAEYVKQAGGDPELLATWAGSQGGSSWSSHSKAVKWWWVNNRDVPQDNKNYYWRGGKGDSVSDYTRIVSKNESKWHESLAALHAHTYELLNTVHMPNVDIEKGLVQLIRTEDKDVMQLEQMVKGKKKVMTRGALESTSLIRSFYLNGSEVTIQNVPLHRIMGTYAQARTAGHNHGMFLGDHENEFVAALEGIEAQYVNKTDVIPSFNSKEPPHAPAAMKQKSAVTYNAPAVVEKTYAQKVQAAYGEVIVNDAKSHMGDSGIGFSKLTGVPGSDDNYASYKALGGKAQSKADFLSAYFNMEKVSGTKTAGPGMFVDTTGNVYKYVPKQSKYNTTPVSPAVTPLPPVVPVAAIPAKPQPPAPAHAPTPPLVGTDYDKKVAAAASSKTMWNTKNTIKDTITPNKLNAKNPAYPEGWDEYKAGGGVLQSYSDYLKVYFIKNDQGSYVVKPSKVKKDGAA